MVAHVGQHIESVVLGNSVDVEDFPDESRGINLKTISRLLQNSLTPKDWLSRDIWISLSLDSFLLGKYISLAPQSQAILFLRPIRSTRLIGLSH